MLRLKERGVRRRSEADKSVPISDSRLSNVGMMKFSSGHVVEPIAHEQSVMFGRRDNYLRASVQNDVYLGPGKPVGNFSRTATNYELFDIGQKTGQRELCRWSINRINIGQTIGQSRLDFDGMYYNTRDYRERTSARKVVRNS